MQAEALGPVVAVASEAVRDATRFMRTVDPGAIGATLTTSDGSPVTVADFVVQTWRRRSSAIVLPIRSWPRRTPAR